MESTEHAIGLLLRGAQFVEVYVQLAPTSAAIAWLDDVAATVGGDIAMHNEEEHAAAQEALSQREIAAQVQLCQEFLAAAQVDESFGVLDIEAKLAGLQGEW